MPRPTPVPPDPMTSLWNAYRQLGDALRSLDGPQMAAKARWMLWLLERSKARYDDTEQAHCENPA